MAPVDTRGTPEKALAKLRRAAQISIDELPHPAKQFELDIGWAENYDDLFQGNYTGVPETTILPFVLERGRGILIGRGGSGKTYLLHRIARTAIKKKMLPVLIDLREWKKSDYGAWMNWAARLKGGAGFLLERFSNPRTSALELDWVPPSVSKLLLVDGLNEISAQVGQEILIALDDFVRSQIQTSVLVSDRLARRELPSLSRWCLGRVLPLSSEKIVKYAGRNVARQHSLPAMLDLPFFLDSALRQSGDRESLSITTHAEQLEKETGLVGADLTAASRAAFIMYEQGMSRTFELAEFSNLAGEEVTNKLLATGALRRETRGAQFSHHLLHDALAAHYVANLDDAAWNRATLNTISFNRSSFDTIALVFEQLQPLRADSFLRRVYDWNLYAAGYALGELQAGMAGPSMEMAAVISAMLGEKRFDPVVSTRRKAGDGLLLSRLPTAFPFRDAPSLNAVIAAAAAIETETEWFMQWRSVFTRAPGSHVDNEDLNALRAPDSIIGWTWANVLKRVVISDKQQNMLRAMTVGEESDITRWRVAHVLGAFPSNENAETLVTLLDLNVDSSIRYGAVRSLAEMAHRGSGIVRAAIAESLQGLVTVLQMEQQIVDELMHAMIIIPEVAPADWYQFVLKVSRAFYAQSEEPAERDRWRQYVADAEALYAA